MFLRLLSSMLFLGLMTFASSALASGFFVARFGGAHGHPTTTNATSMYYNPAGLAFAGKTQLHLEGIFAKRTFTYDRPAEAVDPQVPEAYRYANYGEGKVDNILGSPFIGASSDFGIEGFGAGIAVYGPIGGVSIFDQRDDIDPGQPNLIGAQDGPARWWSIEGTIRSVYLTATAAYKLPSTNLAIGVSLNGVLSQVDSLRAKTAPNDDRTITDLGDGFEGCADEGDEGLECQRPNEGRSYAKVQALEPALGIGLFWRPSKSLSLGLSYQSAPNFGSSELKGEGQLLVGENDFDEPNTTSANPKIKFYQHLPDVIQWGLAYKLNEKTEIRTSGNYIRWSLFDRQCIAREEAENTCSGQGVLLEIPRDWEDGYAVRVGSSYWINKDLEVVLDLGYDSNAVPDERLDPALFDTTKQTVGAGAYFSPMDGMTLGLMYTQVIYDDRTVAVETSLNQPNSAGDYSQSIGVLNASIEYAFGGKAAVPADPASELVPNAEAP